LQSRSRLPVGHERLSGRHRLRAPALVLRIEELQIAAVVGGGDTPSDSRSRCLGARHDERMLGQCDAKLGGCGDDGIAGSLAAVGGALGNTLRVDTVRNGKRNVVGFPPVRPANRGPWAGGCDVRPTLNCRRDYAVPTTPEMCQGTCMGRLVSRPIVQSSNLLVRSTGDHLLVPT
jgi:hypothetical protein